MKITFWGTRGSIATLSEETKIYGGNTPCITIEEKDTLLVLDAGSGIRRLERSGLFSKYTHVHILLTHLHMDHIQGLGFLSLFFNQNAKVSLVGPKGTGTPLNVRLARYLSPPLFPVRIRDFTCDLSIREFRNRPLKIDHFTILAKYVCHPGPTLGFRIHNGTSIVTYIPDHEPALGIPNFPPDPAWLSGYSLAEGADILIHDAQFSEERYPDRIGWGHCTFRHALLFAQVAKAKRLEMFHHDPEHSDQDLQRLISQYPKEDWPFEFNLAREDRVIQLS